jgi:hypothetical protein
MLRILPEIVELAGAEDDVGDAVLGFEHLERAAVEILVARVRLEDAERPLVLRPYPFQSASAVDVFEPDIRIARSRVLGRSRRRHRGKSCCRSQSQYLSTRHASPPTSRVCRA